jgi:hypothetical protein
MQAAESFKAQGLTKYPKNWQHLKEPKGIILILQTQKKEKAETIAANFD